MCVEMVPWFSFKYLFVIIFRRYFRAVAEASAIIAQYSKEAEAYEHILSSSGLAFTVEGFISYLGVRVISDAKNPVYIGLQSPAKSSYP